MTITVKAPSNSVRALAGPDTDYTLTLTLFVLHIILTCKTFTQSGIGAAEQVSVLSRVNKSSFSSSVNSLCVS